MDAVIACSITSQNSILDPLDSHPNVIQPWASHTTVAMATTSCQITAPVLLGVCRNISNCVWQIHPLAGDR
jgi:hypothetical protein